MGFACFLANPCFESRCKSPNCQLVRQSQNALVCDFELKALCITILLRQHYLPSPTL